MCCVVYFALLTLGLTACSAPLSGPRRPDSAVNAGPRARASADAPVTDTSIREGVVADTSDLLISGANAVGAVVGGQGT